MDEKKWVHLQIFSAILFLLLLILYMLVLGERQVDGTFTLGKQHTIWSDIILVFMVAAGFLGALIEVRKRTGKRITLKTVILTILWFIGIALLVLKLDSIRSGQFLLMLLWPQ